MHSKDSYPSFNIWWTFKKKTRKLRLVKKKKSWSWCYNKVSMWWGENAKEKMRGCLQQIKEILTCRLCWLVIQTLFYWEPARLFWPSFLAWNSPLSHYYPFLLACKQISLNMPSAKMKVQCVQDTFHLVTNKWMQKTRSEFSSQFVRKIKQKRGASTGSEAGKKTR